jgi:signal transduction histidine kinase/CheY-like chemotaxis protein
MWKGWIFGQIKGIRETCKRFNAFITRLRRDEIRIIRFFAIALAVLLTLFTFTFILFEVMSIKERAYDNALAAAAAFRKDLIYWNSAMGGVFVPLSEKAQPDIHLPLNMRSISVASQTYVRINPAYMTRLAYETSGVKTPFTVRTVAVDPIRDDNKADEWERAALIRFERNETNEIAEVVKNSAGERIFRYIAPFTVNESCLACHAQHAYTVGAVKGGISSSFSFEPYLQKASGSKGPITATYLVLWIATLALIYFATEHLYSVITKKNEAISLATEANKAKSVFFMKISHSIRTPLNAIIGLSEVELRKKHLADSGKNLRKINSSGASLLALVDDVLDISEIQSGKFELLPANYDMANLISAVTGDNIVKIGLNPITFELSVDSSVPKKLRGDDHRIKQVLNKLLSNAFKHTQSGKVGFTAQKISDDETIVSLKFIISDTGPGIEPSELSGVFSPEIDDKIEESDLSLSICKEIAEKMNGSLTVESTLKKGTSFTFTICQEIAEAAPIGKKLAQQLCSFSYQENVATEISKIEIVKMPYARVLVVDDVNTNLEVAKGLLAPYEIAVDCVTNAGDMLAAVRNSKVRYNAVFMDYMMPGTNGLEALKLIRSEPTEYAKAMPVIALTAYAVKGAEEYFLQNGFSDYLTKPINVVKLNQVLNNWVKNTEQEISYKPISDPAGQAPQKGGEREIPDLLQISIPSLDVKKGISLFGASEYLKILRSFVIHTPKLLERIGNVELSTLSDYAVVVHGLKGASYGINATELASFAGELELLAKGGNFKAVNAGNKKFLDKIHSLIDGINSFLTQVDAAMQQKARKDAPDPSVLEAVYKACLQFDITAMEDYVAQLERVEYEDGGEIVAWLRRQLDDLEYESIISRLTSYLGKDRL